MVCVQTLSLCIMYISGIRVVRIKGESCRSYCGSLSECVHRLISFGWGVHKYKVN